MKSRSRIVISTAWKETLAAAGLTTMEEIYSHPKGEIITRSGSTQVLRIPMPVSAPANTVFLKKYWFDSPRRRFRGIFRETFFGRSKARREYENLLRLQSWDIPAPDAIAYGEERRGGWLFRSFLISASVASPIGLDVFIARVLPAMPKDKQREIKEVILAKLADQTRALHQRGFVHQDYFWRNILFSQPHFTAFYLIDAHKGRLWQKGRSNRARATDLAALDAPAPWYFRQTERLRFFLRYCNQTRLTRKSKALVRQVLTLAGPMRQRQHQRVENRAASHPTHPE